ncbi:MAG: chemotaxis protein [Clostridium sartagoforme]|nr:chemotaxis protein [Clostridium sartagoforme]
MRIKGKNKRETLRFYVTKLLFLVSAVPLIVLGLVNFYSLNKSVLNLRNTIMENNIGAINESIAVSDRRSVEDINFLSNDANAKGIKDNKNNEVQWLEKLFKSYRNSKPDIINIYMASVDGKLILEPYEDVGSNYEARERDWYKNAVNNPDKVILSDPYKDYVTNQVMITYSKAVFNDKNELQGVIAVDKDLGVLFQLAPKIENYKGAYSVTFNHDGTIIGHEDLSQIGKNADDFPWIKKIINLEDDNRVYVKTDGKNYLVHKSINEKTGYMVCAFIPSAELVKSYLTKLIPSIGLFIITLIIVGFCCKRFIKKLSNPINEVVRLLNKLKEGDFSETSEIKDEYNEEIANMLGSVNNLSYEMGKLLSGIIDEANSVNDGSSTLFEIIRESSNVGEEVAKSVQEIAQGATSQAMQLDDGVKMIGELEQEINKSKASSDKMLKTSADVKLSTGEGRVAMEELSEKYAEDKEANDNIVNKVNLLADKSNEIGIIVEAMQSITEQTNLLALNASIEAARVGEAGKGFAVVAEEVRKLAEESAKSAAEINNVIVEVKDSINVLYTDILKSSELNNETGASLIETRDKFEVIDNMINELEENIKEVTNSLGKIDSCKENVAVKISEVAAVGEETAAITEEVSAASEEQSSGLQEIANEADGLKEDAIRLKKLVEKFKI